MTPEMEEKMFEQMKIRNMLLCNIYVVLATQNQDKYFTGEGCYEKFYDIIHTINEKCCDVILEAKD